MATKKTIRKKKRAGRSTDLTLQWLVRNHGKEWELWRQLAEEWISNQEGGISQKLQTLFLLFEVYLVSSAPWTSDVVGFFVGKNGLQASADEFKRIVLENTNRCDNKSSATILHYTSNFIDWVLDTHFSEPSDKGTKVHMYINPMRHGKRDGRSADMTLQWLVRTHGQEWESWRNLAEEWISNQDSVSDKLPNLSLFFEVYLVSSAPWTSDVVGFLVGKNGWKASSDEFKRILLEKTNRSHNSNTSTILNNASNFIDWVLDTHFSELSDKGTKVRLYANPLEKVKQKRRGIETVYNPLPYRYICDLRNILCPKPRGNFSDWLWAQENVGG